MALDPNRWTRKTQEAFSAAVELHERAPERVVFQLRDRPAEQPAREQLRQHLWPAGTYVDFEHSLNAAVKRLHAALGDDADNPRFVETLPRRGYRFIARLDTSGTPGTLGTLRHP